MRAPFQDGNFPGPVKYDYASVGEVLDGSAGLQGQKVFCLYPHQRRYSVPAVAVIPVPVTISGWGVREGAAENQLPCDVGVQCVPDHGLPACMFVVSSV